MTNAPTRLRRVDLLSGYPVVVPGAGGSVSCVAVEFNGLVDDLVQQWRRLSFFLMHPSYAVAVVSS